MTDNTTRDSKAPMPSHLRNWTSMAGIVLACSSFFAVACLIAIDSFREFSNPYMGLLTYMVAPAFLVLGIFLTVLGALLERHRRHKRAPSLVPFFPRIDLNLPRHRRILLVVILCTFAFLLLTALGSYRTYQFTESVMFCGKTCHTVMEPEYTAYQESPHARVACVQCHIGPGATWFVKSKLSGAYQVYAAAADKYPRPIPVPVKNLRPAQETCEQCHWPQKFYGEAERTFHHYLDNEKNSLWTTRMLVKTGGGDPSFGPVSGIHWHMNIANRIEYIASDTERQVIPWVRLTDRQGKVTVFQSTDNPLKPEEVAAAQPRRMDCIDCHNRPSHIYTPPVRSVDTALNTGRIDANIPYVKKQAVGALVGAYETKEAALAGIAKSMTTYYQAEYADFAKANPQLIAQAIGEVQKIYGRSFFPHMKVNWQTYPDNIGHLNFPGCDRCHDGKHAAAEGKTITRDCSACHTIIAQGRDKDVTSDLNGLKFKHPVNIGDSLQTMKCSECHHGSLVE